MTAANGLLLPPGTRLLHIGPHKTGTTTVQSSFHAARRALRAKGVFYPGPNSQPMWAIYGVTGQMPEYVKDASIDRWERLVDDVRRSSAGRVVISSEGFCDADDAAIERIVEDLGRGDVHVVVTLRPLPHLLTSQWQQSVQDGMPIDYEPWLRTIFDAPDSRVATRFWHRHRHDRLVERWARVVGRDRVTVVLVDPKSRDAALRVFEELVGLRTGTLGSDHSRTNRSLTKPEIAFVRSLHAALRADGVRPAVAVRIVRDGVAELLRRRAAALDEARITTPAWALDRARAVSEEIIAGLGAMNVRIVGGSLESLRVDAAADPGGRATEPAQSTERAPSTELAGPTEPGTDVTDVIAAAGPIGVLALAGRLREWNDGNEPADLAGLAGSAAWRPVMTEVHRFAPAGLATAQVRRALVARLGRWLRDHLPARARRVAAEGAAADPTAALASDRPAWADAAAALTLQTVRSVTPARGLSMSRFESLEIAVLGNRELLVLLLRRVIARVGEVRTAVWPRHSRADLAAPARDEP